MQRLEGNTLTTYHLFQPSFPQARATSLKTVRTTPPASETRTERSLVGVGQRPNVQRTVMVCVAQTDRRTLTSVF